MAMIDNFKICSYNCNGLNDSKKRKDVFEFLRKKKADIYCLQETHLLAQSENFIRANWGYNVWVSGSDTNKNGVAILFNNTFEYKIIDVQKDNHGCYIVMSVEFLKKKCTLVNLYGPSCGDKPDFFDNVCRLIENMGNDHVIVTGDWNCALNTKLDTRNYTSIHNRPRTRKKIQGIMTHYNLFDIFREIYPEKRSYTWRKFNSIKQARLDYFLVSEEVLNMTSNVVTEPAYRSDHSLVMLLLKKEQFKRDRPFWKLNNSLLRDRKYILEIKKIISEIKKQYAVPVYDVNNIDNIPNDDIAFVINDKLFFETLMMEIRGKTISYSTFKKKTELEKERELEKEIIDLEQSLQDNNVSHLEKLKTQLQEIRESRIQGIAVRSRIRWINEGEKTSRYFCSLEKRQFLDKTIPFLEKDDGHIITDQECILNEVKIYYEKLYSSQDNPDVNIPTNLTNAPVLTHEDSELLEGQITYTEAAAALKNMKNFKSPGPDGFTVEFFKFFFIDIGPFLVRSVNEGFLEGQLSISQRQGSITCIPKEGKPKRFIKNWRPISLLNTAYKIASACIANRLKHVLPNVINECQRGFMKGRYIGENIRLIYDTIVYTENEDIPGMLFTVDFEKAFDSVSWSFLQKCLSFFNFGPDIIRWVTTFYSNISTCIGVNSQYSSWFSIKRGVRQGDPCSPYLYLICAEILSLMIRNNSDIKGISINNEENLLSQFADDTTLFLDGSEKSFREAIFILSRFSLMSGLKINFEKSQIIWLGSQKNSNIRYMRDKNFIWDPGTFKVLGIMFSTNVSSIVSINYQGKLCAMKNIMAMWRNRNVTPYGKIIVIKTLVFSKIVHLLINLPDPPEQFIFELEKELYSFLWNGKQNKIKKSVVCKQYCDGGLCMLNIRTFLSSMKLNWLKRLLHECPWKRFTFNMYPCLGKMYDLGVEYADIVSKNVCNPFWCDVMKHYKLLSKKCSPINVHELMAECIHYNVNFLRGQQTIFVQEWYDHGILYVKQLLNETGHFLSYVDFLYKFPNVNTNFLLFEGIIKTIRLYCRKHNIVLTYQYMHFDSKVWFCIKKGSKFVQNIINKNNAAPTAIRKWNNMFENLEWKKIFSLCHKVTQEAQLKWFQTRLLHRLLPTQKYLHLCKLVDSPVCNFCNQEIQTISHMLYDCTSICQFWTDIQEILKDKCQHFNNLSLDKELILFGIKKNTETDKILNFIILHAKFYIYKCKLQDLLPSIPAFICVLKDKYMLEQYNSYIHNRQNQFKNDWHMYLAIVS